VKNLSLNKMMSILISYFSLVRVQNILLLTLAFFLTAHYIFIPEQSWGNLLTNPSFILLIISTNMAVSAGYLINSFYDYKEDLINRPQKTLLEGNLKQKERLYLYFTFNLLAVILAAFISWRGAAFISFYIFLMWLYSHKIKSYVFIGNLMSAVLYIFPFFGLFLFFKKFNWFIFWHAVFLWIILLIKDVVKSLINIKGEIANNKKSLPVKYGEKATFKVLFILSILLLIPILILFEFEMLGHMRWYFYLFIITYYPFLLFTYLSKKKQNVYYFYLLIKLLLLIGVFSLILINFK
jgi:4-hydroxybenzoate polyprenyltransferase